MFPHLVIKNTLKEREFVTCVNIKFWFSARGQVERCYYCYDTDSSCDRGTALAKQTCTFDLGSANQEANPQKSSSGSYSSSGSEFPENFGNPNSRGGGQYSCVVARIYDSKFANNYC